MMVQLLPVGIDAGGTTKHGQCDYHSKTMKKANSHRKRHVPPGPVGIWFQTQQQLHSSKQRSGDAASLTEDQVLQRHSASQERDNHNNNNNNKSCNDLSFSPVWSSVQQSLNIITPYLPTWNNDPKQRFEWLRPHLPTEYILLWEILRGDYDFATPENSRLLLLVSSIESHNLHNIWTVELQDETGLTIRAWMEPRYVQEQMQQQHESSSTIRPGVIWMLSGVGMMVETNEHEEKLERILLIGGKHIVQVWTPEKAKQNDSTRPETDFLLWMEQRKAKSNFIADMDDTDEPDDASKENHRHNHPEYSLTSKVNEDPTNVDEVENCEENNDWVSLLRQHDTEEGSYPSIQVESTCSPSLPRESMQQQTTQALQRQRSHDPLPDMRRDDRQTAQSQHHESLTNAHASGDIQQIQNDPATSNNMSCPNNSDKDPQGAKRNHLHVSNHAHPSPNTIRRHTQQSKQSSKPKQKSPKRTKATKKKRSSRVDDSSSVGSSNLWDSIQDTSILQLLDDEDADEEEHRDNGKEDTETTVQSKEMNTERDSPTDVSTSCQTTTGRVDRGTASQTMNETSSPPQSQSQTANQASSLFEASNFEGLDFSVFDDD
jgi:hypothetical protein